jgi:hypothetical protein
VRASLPPFRTLYSFIPACAVSGGWRVREVPVAHRPRLAGTANYTFRKMAIFPFLQHPRLLLGPCAGCSTSSRGPMSRGRKSGSSSIHNRPAACGSSLLPVRSTPEVGGGSPSHQARFLPFATEEAKACSAHPALPGNRPGRSRSGREQSAALPHHPPYDSEWQRMAAAAASAALVSPPPRRRGRHQDPRSRAGSSS